MRFQWQKTNCRESEYSSLVLILNVLSAENNHLQYKKGYCDHQRRGLKGTFSSSPFNCTTLNRLTYFKTEILYLDYCCMFYIAFLAMERMNVLNIPLVLGGSRPALQEPRDENGFFFHGPDRLIPCFPDFLGIKKQASWNGEKGEGPSQESDPCWKQRQRLKFLKEQQGPSLSP